MSAQTIFEQLRKAGCTPTGALALMGNWQCESNLEPCRVQGDFQSDRQKSKDYASRIDNALVSDEQWCRDGLGWGLAQWTYWSRKQALLTFCRRRSISVANETAQVDFAVSELKSSFSTVWSMLTKAEEEDLYSAVELVCRRYEAPAFNNIQARVNAALDLKKQLQAQATEEIDNGVERFWPPRELCEGMNGPDVEAMQSLLKAHGYTLSGTGGVFCPSSTSALRKFQEDNGLDVDGICGKKQSWPALLKL